MFIHVFLGTLSKQYKGNFILPNFELLKSLDLFKFNNEDINKTSMYVVLVSSVLNLNINLFIEEAYSMFYDQ